MFNNHSKQSGFTLVEVMVSVTIVVTGVLALQSFYIAIIRSEQLSQDRITAVHVAEQVIEEWQQSNTLPTVSCMANAATALTLATATSCKPNSGAATTFSITPNATRAQAPSPTAVWGNMPAIGGVTPEIRTVTVSWDYKGLAKSIMLTHLTPAP